MALRDINVLHFDDDAYTHRPVRAVFDRLGIIYYEQMVSVDGAVRYIEKTAPAVLLLDTMSSGKVIGPGIAQAAREMGQDPIVIALSAEPDARFYWFNIREFLYYKGGNHLEFESELERVFGEIYQELFG